MIDELWVDAGWDAVEAVLGENDTGEDSGECGYTYFWETQNIKASLYTELDHNCCIPHLKLEGETKDIKEIKSKIYAARTDPYKELEELKIKSRKK